MDQDPPGGSAVAPAGGPVPDMQDPVLAAFVVKQVLLQLEKERAKDKNAKDNMHIACAQRPKRNLHYSSEVQ